MGFIIRPATVAISTSTTSAWRALTFQSTARQLQPALSGGKAQHSTGLRLGENPAAICSVKSFSKVKNGANTKQVTTKRAGDQAIDLTETESSVEEGATKRCKHGNGLDTETESSVEEGATKRSKHGNGLDTRADNELIDLTGGLETLAETIGELKHQKEMELSAAIESAMTKFVPTIVAAFAATQKMKKTDSVQSKKEENEDNVDESDSE